MAVMPVELTVLHSQTITANGNSSVILPPVGYWGCILYLSAGIPTGTSPTLDVYIQQGFTALQAADNLDGLQVTNPAIYSIWDDYAHFTQLTFSATAQAQVMRAVAEIGTSSANSPTASFTAAQSGALTAGKVQPGPFGLAWRVLWTVGGTSPSWPTVSITGQFMLPQG